MKKSNIYRISIIVLHIIGWLLLMLLPILTGPSIQKSNYSFTSFIHVFLLGAFFYFNMYYLIPKLLLRKKVINYIASCLTVVSIAIAIIVLLRQYDKKNLVPPNRDKKFEIGFDSKKPRPFGTDIFPTLISLLFVFGLSTSFKTISEYLKNEKKQSQTEKEKLNSELSFLKSQVSPHFLFNTLNNIYTLASINSKDTAPAIMKLSEMLRYMIYESEDEKVWLSREIKYLRGYVELQKLRIPPGVTVNFNVETDSEKKLIAPMLLVPFVENAFKHGVSYINNSFIDIEIKSQESFISIKVTNSVNNNVDKDSSSGIGLQNVKRRLELLYPKRYRIEIRKSETEFYVDLRIDISQSETDNPKVKL